MLLLGSSLGRHASSRDVTSSVSLARVRFPIHVLPLHLVAPACSAVVSIGTLVQKCFRLTGVALMRRRVWLLGALLLARAWRGGCENRSG